MDKPEFLSGLELEEWQAKRPANENGQAPESEKASAEEAYVAKLASLRLFDYEQIRSGAAAKLGVRASILDKLVAGARHADEAHQGQGRQLKLPSPVPWPEAVDGPALVDAITNGIRKYVVLSADAAFTVALWVLHAHCFDSFSCSPRLAITAPEKRCGKTTLLDVIKPLVPRALHTANVTAAATFRAIETLRPTLLIDEADTFFGANEELRGLLNSGHRAGGQVIRTVGDEHEPRLFATHCPVAIAQIGKLPDTLADRSINIELKRRGPGEQVARLRIGKTPELDELARKAARWIADNIIAISACEPSIPDAIYNRAADNWEPLLAIAEIVGGPVPERARQVAMAACGVEEEPSRGTMLLADIRDVFADSGQDRITSAYLVEALISMEDRPWGECNRGRAMTPNLLARRLKPFGISSKDIGPKNNRLKGYELAQFRDAFLRYSPNPPLSSAHARTLNEINDLGQNKSAHRKNGCADEISSNPLNLKELRECAVQNPQTGNGREFGSAARLSAAESLLLDALHDGVEIRPIGEKVTVNGDASPQLRARLDELWPEIEALFGESAARQSRNDRS